MNPRSFRVLTGFLVLAKDTLTNGRSEIAHPLRSMFVFGSKLWLIKIDKSKTISEKPSGNALWMSLTQK